MSPRGGLGDRDEALLPPAGGLESLGSLDDPDQSLEPLLERWSRRTSSMMGDENDAAEPSARQTRSEGATVLHCIFNVVYLLPAPFFLHTFFAVHTVGLACGQVNLFMGVGLLSLPYAVRLGGWMAVPALALVTLMFGYSANLIVEGFQKVQSSVQSYASLGEAAFGPMGRKAVTLCIFLDLLGGCTICLIMSCKQIEGLILPRMGFMSLTPSQVARAVGISAAGASVFIRSFSQLAFMSVLGIFCSVGVTLAVVLSAAFDLQRRHTIVPSSEEPPEHHLISVGLVRSIGIFALSMAGHSSLPSFRNSMSNPSRFHVVVTAAFLAMLAFNAIIACIGYWYWGDDVSEVVMQDIALKSPLTDLFGIGMAMTALIGVNAFSKVPTILLIMQDMALSTVFAGKPTANNLGLMLKIGLFVGVAILTSVAYDALGTIMSLLGGLTSMNASVVFPALFYLKLFWGDIGVARRTLVFSILVVSVALSVFIVGDNIRGIIAGFSGK